MPIPKIKITKKKDGREVAWFRDNQGRVRTSAGPMNWTRVEQMKQLSGYSIVLQVEQARAGLGSDGQPMPPLKGGSSAIFVVARNGKATFTRKSYGEWKSAHGLQPIRDLWGEGKGGHMLDDIRTNSLDDKRATIAITTLPSRQKARANEQRAAWWGWSPVSVRKLTEYAAEVFQTGMAEMLYTFGLIGANALSEAKRMWRKVA